MGYSFDILQRVVVLFYIIALGSLGIGAQPTFITVAWEWYWDGVSL